LEKIEVSNTTKGKLTGEYHFARVFIWDKSLDQIEPRMLVIRKTPPMPIWNNTHISHWRICKHSGSLSNIASKNKNKYWGLDRFQTRKWLAWLHQVTLNLLVSSFILKEKLFYFDDLPLLSTKDIMEMFVF
jgi:hypothetical protein